MEEKTKWTVFNQGEGLEFAGCPKCGHEVEPDPTERNWYPDRCPGCGAVMDGTEPAEEE